MRFARPRETLLWAALASVVLFVVVAPAGPGGAAGQVPIRRFAGATRYGTAAAIAIPGLPPAPGSRVVLASGEDFPDALSAGYLAGVMQAPVLLTPRDGLAEETLAVLRRLQPSVVSVLGGLAAVGPVVRDRLAAEGWVVDNTSYAGASRYATASAAARSAPSDLVGTIDGKRAAIVVSGVSFADALAAGPLAAGARLPILLTEPGRLSPEALDALSRLGTRHVLLIGGESAVASGVADELAGGGRTVERLAGSTRSGTALAAANFAYGRLAWPATGGIGLVNGQSFADALAAGPYAGRQRQPLLLAPGRDELGEGNIAWLQAKAGAVPAVTAYGGVATLSDPVVDQAASAAASATTPTSSTTSTSTSTSTTLPPVARPPIAFAGPDLYDVGSWPDSVAIGDVTGDGRNDVVMTTSYYFDPGRDWRVWVFAQRSDGALSAPVSYATGRSLNVGAMGLSIGDLNGDGRNDVAVSVNIGVAVFLQTSGGLLGTPEFRPTPSSVEGTTVADIDGDGFNDIAAALNDGLAVLYGSATGLSPAVLIGTGRTGEVEVGDVTGDGVKDLVTVGMGQPKVYRQLTPRSFPSAQTLVTDANVFNQSWGVEVADATGDGRNDVIVSVGGNRPNSRLNVFVQTAAGALADPAVYPAYDLPEPVEARDLNGDTRPDVVTLHGGWNRAGVFLQDAAGRLAVEVLVPIPYASHYQPGGLALGDVNGDGRPDIVVADYNSGLVVLRQVPA